MTPPILITGGAGFIGSNLADRLLADGHRVRVYDALSRAGTERNLAWLQSRHAERIEFIHADVRDHDRLRAAATDVQAVFHFAAQVAVTTSLADPAEDFAINIGGTFALLEALRARQAGGGRRDAADLRVDQQGLWRPGGPQLPR